MCTSLGEDYSLQSQHSLIACSSFCRVQDSWAFPICFSTAIGVVVVQMYTIMNYSKHVVHSMMLLSNQNFEPFNHIFLLFLLQFSPILLLPVSLWFHELYFLKFQHRERQMASTFLCLISLHWFGSSWVFSHSTRNANRGRPCV